MNKYIKEFCKKTGIMEINLKLENFLVRGSGAASYKDFFSDPSRLKFLLNLVKIKRIDKRKGTNFFGEGNQVYGRLKQSELGISRERANNYSGSPMQLVKVLKRYHISEEDSIIDVGCGMGLAMWYMERFPFKKIAGLEISEYLLSEAIENLKKVSKYSECLENKFDFFLCDAGDFTNLDSYTYIYIYIIRFLRL